MSAGPCPHAARPHVSALCRDDGTVLALAVVRSVASGYMTGDAACWDTAFTGAERILGDVEGPRFVAALAAVVRAIRVDREGEWQFLPATCCRATADEADLVAALQAGDAALGPACRRVAGDRPAPHVERTVAEARRAVERANGLIAAFGPLTPGTALSRH